MFIYVIVKLLLPRNTKDYMCNLCVSIILFLFFGSLEITSILKQITTEGTMKKVISHYKWCKNKNKLSHTTTNQKQVNGRLILLT